MRSTRPDFGALAAADFDCDGAEFVFAWAPAKATDRLRMQAKTNRNARADADGFLITFIIAVAPLSW